MENRPDQALPRSRPPEKSPTECTPRPILPQTQIMANKMPGVHHPPSFLISPSPLPLSGTGFQPVKPRVEGEKSPPFGKRKVRRGFPAFRFNLVRIGTPENSSAWSFPLS